MDELEVGQEEGLAQRMATPQDAGMTVERVIALLKQGISPQELIERGVPMELLQQAAQVLMQMEQEAGQQMPPQQGMAQGQQMQGPPQGLGQAMAGRQ